jgi:hypothetical protein
MKAYRVSVFSLASLGPLVAAMLVAPSALGEDSDADRRESACLLIEPVICRSSDGKEPAVSRLDRKAIESVYAQANIQIAWLQPRYLDHTAARDGTVNWKKVSEIGKERGLWESGPIRLSLVFVNTIGGKSGPRGLGAIDSRPERPFGPGGPICMVALPEKQKDSVIETFCVAHEIGHCLGLIHADKDPLVPDDEPSIMGGGKYSDRIGPNALMPSHIDQVRKSKLLWWPSNP